MIPSRPKGALTDTARGSKWGCLGFAILALANLALYFFDSTPRESLLIPGVGFFVPALVYLRSWRILSRAEV